MAETGPETTPSQAAAQPNAETPVATTPQVVPEKKGIFGFLGGLGNLFKRNEVLEPVRPNAPPAQPEQLRDPVVKLPQDQYKPV